MLSAPSEAAQISKVTLADVDDVVSLTMEVFFGTLGSDLGFNNCRATAFYQLNGEQKSSVRKSILASYPNANGDASAFKAMTPDGRLIGFVACSEDRLLTNLAVDPIARRQSIGRRLVEQVLIEAGGQPVLLEVDRDNAPAIALYAACGFQVTEEKSGTRYAVDWWRGRVVEEVFRVAMRHEGIGDSAMAIESVSATCDASDPTGLCVVSA